MALFEDALKGGNIVTGLAIGIGAAVLAPMAKPLLRPVFKGVVKAGILAYDQGRVTFAEMNERTSDVIAEARSEMNEAHRQSNGTGAARPAETETTDEKFAHS